MWLAAIPMVVLSLLLPQVQASGGHNLTEEPLTIEPCPAWFKEAPALGRGRPEAVTVFGLTEVTVCSYYGPPLGIHFDGDEPQKTNLLGERTIGRRHRVRSLARAFNRLLPYGHAKREPRYCPNESSGGFYVRFRHQDGRRASVKVIPTGCRRAVAGKLGRWLFLPSYLERRLEGMVPPSRDEG